MKRNLRSRDKWVSPWDEAKTYIEMDKDPPGLCMAYYGSKGRGVKTLKRNKKGDFLVQYAGELISAEEGERREAIKSTGYRFFYQYKGKKLCVDGTEETGRFGRLVNHGHKQERNCVMKQVHGTLCLFCTRDIEEGEELLYDYGVNDLPWTKVFTLMNNRSRKCDIIVNSSDFDVECKLQLEGEKIYLKDFKKSGRYRCMRNNSIFLVGGREFRIKINGSLENSDEESKWIPASDSEHSSVEEISSEAEDGLSENSDQESDWIPPSDSEHSSVEEISSEAEDGLSENSDQESNWIPPSDNEHSSVEEISLRAEDYQDDKTAVKIPPSVSEVEDEGITISNFRMAESESSAVSDVIPVKNIIIQQANHHNNRRSEKLHSCLFLQ